MKSSHEFATDNGKRYRFLREVDAEFQEQISYFDKQASGLGDRFVADVDATVADIRRYPESGSLHATFRLSA